MVKLPHDAVAELAVKLWDNAGRPTGRDLELWLMAERQLMDEMSTRKTIQRILAFDTLRLWLSPKLPDEPPGPFWLLFNPFAKLLALSFLLLLPALLLNYFGQGALVLAHPETIGNPFYLLFPEWALYPMVALATAATVIASQAVITGAYSITRQAMQLGFLPRMEVRHTSEALAGQIYMPRVNYLLLTGVLLLVFMFRSSSELAAAYVLAVATTVWTAGVRPPELVAELPLRKTREGRIVVDEHLRALDPEGQAVGDIYVIGDSGAFSINDTAVTPAVMTTQALTKSSTTAAIAVLLARFTIPPFPSVCCWLPTDHIAHGPLELKAEQLKLTR